MLQSHHSKTALWVVCTVFFSFGALTCLNDLLAPQLKSLFSLNYAEMMLIQFCFFLTYFLLSWPFSILLKRIGYRQNLVIGLVITFFGCLFLTLADMFMSYLVYLFAVFVLAAGIVNLQVTANPLASIIGDADKAASRLTFAQALNSLGTTIAPLLFGGLVMAGYVKLPYVIFMGILLLIILLVLRWLPRNIAENTSTTTNLPLLPNDYLWQNKLFIFGLLMIFVYVGTEVSAGTLVVSFLNLPNIADMPRMEAAKYLTFFWGGALVGRFIGAYILRKISASRFITINAIINAILILSVIFTSGSMAMWSILSLGLFNSIMFPSIFSVTLDSVPTRKSQASGLLCMAIVGGAIIPEMQGLLADRIGLQHSFILLVLGYALIAWFGIYSYRRTTTAL